MNSTSGRIWTKGRAIALVAGLTLAATAGAQILVGAAGDQSFNAALSVLRAQALGAAARQQAAPGLRLRGVADRVKPDFTYTPGALCTPDDPNFQEYRYAEHVAYCKRNVTEAMKEQIAAHYGVPKSEWANYEFDHLIPLAAGGSSSIDNVWPQPHGDPDGSNGKDKLEDQIYQQMNDGSLKQADGVQQIYAWFGVTPTNQ